MYKPYRKKMDSAKWFIIIMTSCSNALPLFSFVQTALIPVKDLALQWSFYNFLDSCHVGIWVIAFMSRQEEGEEQLSCGIRKS